MHTTEISKQTEIASNSRKFIARIYAWMALALLISGITALATAYSQALTNFILATKYNFCFFIIIEFVFVIIISTTLQKLPLPIAIFMFILYSIINGLTLSIIFLVFKKQSIFIIFLISALMFLAMTIYGFTTKQNLNSAGRYLFMALIGLILASVLNLILKSGLFEWIISLVSLVVFIGLTAYDTKKISQAAIFAQDTDTFKKASLYGAFELYLDFINIFLKLLTLFGKKR